jgi:hypothetical protein
MKFFRTWLLLLLFAISGCGGEEVAPSALVKGKVTVNSKALTGGTIHFKVGDNAPVATAIEENGTYSIQVPLGDAKVWFQETSEDAPISVEDPGAKASKVQIPQKYTNESSGLTYTVTSEPEQTKDFDLPGT